MEKFNCPSCKYEFEKGWDGNERNKIIKGDKEPIRLYLSNSINVYKYGDRGLYEEDEQVNLIACPKCKTVIIEE